MSELGDAVTLLDIQRRLDPNENIDSRIAELLTETNEVLEFLPWKTSNQTMSELITVRNSEPSGEWFQYNEGFTTGKSTTTQQTEVCGMLGRYSEIDYEMLKLNNFDKMFRFSEEKAFVSGLSKDMAEAFFYSNHDLNAKKPHGLSPRYSAISSVETNIGYNVLSGEGSGEDITSVWLVGFSPETVYGIYPKGTKPGLKIEDLGRDTKTENGKMREVVKSYFTWYCGFAVKDWRYAVRIANIDKSDLATAGDTTDTSCNLIKLMIQAIDRIPPDLPVRLAFFARNHVHTALKVKLLEKGNLWLNMEDFTTAGSIVRKKLSFMGIPVCRVDRLSDAESIVT